MSFKDGANYRVLRYKFRTLFNVIGKIRASIHNGFKVSAAEESIPPYWSAVLIYNCTANCSYCVQNFSFENGRKDSPLKGFIEPQHWLKLNEISNKPDTFVITGGEPFLYKRLMEVLEGLTTFKTIQVVTNLTLDVGKHIDRLKKIKTHRILFECSYHDSAIDFEKFLSRALLLKEAGLLGSVRIVDVDEKKTISCIKKFADHGINMIPLFQVGKKDDGEISSFANPESSDMVRKPPVLCKTNLTLFSPDGYVYNCHTKLYWNDRQSSFGNIETGFEIPDDYVICHDYGFCNPCQGGYIDIKKVDISNFDKKYRVLYSNPPPGVVKSLKNPV